MDEKRTPLIDEEPKHQKKSKAKGQPRSKHKHIYETVLLISDYHFTDFKTGKTKLSQTKLPTKVCVICGRIGETDKDESYYVKNPVLNPYFSSLYDRELSDKALSLSKWGADGFWDKFAMKIEEPEQGEETQ